MNSNLGEILPHNVTITKLIFDLIKTVEMFGYNGMIVVFFGDLRRYMAKHCNDLFNSGILYLPYLAWKPLQFDGVTM